MKTRFRSFAMFALFLPAFLLLARPHTPALPPLALPRLAPSHPISLSLLDEVGRLARPVTAAEVAGWRGDLHTGHARGEEAAKRQLWLGEWELAKNENPHQAAWRFALARKSSSQKQAVYGVSAYDSAIILFMTGAYDQSGAAFRALLLPQTSSEGYDRRNCALWMRHAGACAGYHAQNSEAGIVEPLRLDPFCGVEALAACLRGQRFPYDKKTMLAHTRVTGLGSNLQDLVTAGNALGLKTYTVSADDEGLKRLPKPLVAHVEGDHFIAVTGADAKGVNYLCSDCGPWPGGRQRLSWKQWHRMNAGVYMAAVKPGSVMDSVLSQLTAIPAKRAEVIRARYRCPAPILTAILRQVALLKSHVILVKAASRRCGHKPQALHSCKTCVPKDGSSSPPFGPQFRDPVNLATGEEEYLPDPDLTVYNPVGPSIAWSRSYASLRDEGDGYGQLWAYNYFGQGWSYNYNVRLGITGAIASSGAVAATLSMDNGSSFSFTSSHPNAYCPPDEQGNEFVLQRVADASSMTHDHYVLWQKDRTQWVFSPVFLNPTETGSYVADYRLTQIIDRNNNAISFLYAVDANTGSVLLSSIRDKNNKTLLTVVSSTDASNPALYGYVTQIYDWQGRTINYSYGSYSHYGGANNTSCELTHVSQIAPNTSTPTADRYAYDYAIIATEAGQPFPYLSKITVPSPAGGTDAQGHPNTSSATIAYDATGLVQRLTDQHGNQRNYDFSQLSETTVTVSDGQGNQNSQYAADFNDDMNETARKDIRGHTLSSRSYDSGSQDPYRPASVTDAYGHTTNYTWDSYGNLLSVQTPHGVTTTTYTTTTYHYDYNHFPLGELHWAQTGSQQKTLYTYADDLNGNDTTGRLVYVDSPLPGTTATHNPQLVRTSYTYTALGNLASITAPGRDANTTTLTTYTYAPTEALGQPMTVTVASSVANSPTLVTSYAYDPRGTTHSITDALGHETDFAYDLTDRITDVTYPLTTAAALSHAVSHTRYLYLGGPVSGTSYQDETQAILRQTNYTYGVDGELLSVSGSAEPVRYTYDSLFRLKTLTDGNPLNSPTGRTTHYYYNTRGYLDAVTYPGYNGPSPILNANGCYGNITGPDSVRFQMPDANGLATPAYDDNGQVTQRIDGNGAVTQYAYNDAENNLTSVTYTKNGQPVTPSQDVTLTYDTVYGRLISETDGAGTYAWTYDDLSLPQTATTQYKQVATNNSLPAWTLTYAYNPNGSRKTTGLSGGTAYNFAYAYDPLGRPASLTNAAAQSFSWAYQHDAQNNSNSWLATQTASGLYQSAYTYNGRGWLTDLKTQSQQAGLIAEFGSASSPMQYDGAGNRTGMSVTMPTTNGVAGYGGLVSYAYDGTAATGGANARGQLTSESNPRVSGGGSFDYDNAGNPTQFRSVPQASPTADNQPGGNTYDGNGSPTTYNGLAYAYDPERRLTSIPSKAAFSAGYRADGLRAWKSALQTAPLGQSHAATQTIRYTPPVTYFLYDGSSIIAELDKNGAATAVNTWGPTGLLARQNVTAGTSSVYTYDPSGNVAQRLDGNGNVVGSYAFDAFGKGVTNDAAPDPYQYGGKWGYYSDSETSLVLCGHRYYDSSNGRWLTRDPIEYRGGINLYGYCGNIGVNGVDPSGFGLFEWLHAECIAFSLCALNIPGYSAHIPPGTDDGNFDPPVTIQKFQPGGGQGFDPFAPHPDDGGSGGDPPPDPPGSPKRLPKMPKGGKPRIPRFNYDACPLPAPNSEAADLAYRLALAVLALQQLVAEATALAPL